ncbi:rhodanese-like domain-containing protein [Haloplanus rallus]|jgi:thiosulfate/3-mercaptopyruvate sulfurtransferase|uniref:Rhodanese-like domain-containing protein n=1 Tax=Haloplanus rallus TaxID=1816183 RepID=A0A6B9FBZ7_9EURY|nr:MULTISPECIES: rhodanese-like domain-containing protein [Haloplanus]QGX93690.1 rhodanese-like domain-containing protein [Haloplanus rallus]
MVEEVTPEELHDRLESGDSPQIVDIRGPREFAAGHIPGAINVPMGELPSRIDEIDWADDVVVACPIGQSSIQAARLIGSYEDVDDAGSVRSMKGGYDAWEYELERDG